MCIYILLILNLSIVCNYNYLACVQLIEKDFDNALSSMSAHILCSPVLLSQIAAWSLVSMMSHCSILPLKRTY